VQSAKVSKNKMALHLQITWQKNNQKIIRKTRGIHGTQKKPCRAHWTPIETADKF